MSRNFWRACSMTLAIFLTMAILGNALLFRRARKVIAQSYLNGVNDGAEMFIDALIRARIRRTLEAGVQRSGPQVDIPRDDSHDH